MRHMKYSFLASLVAVVFGLMACGGTPDGVEATGNVASGDEQRQRLEGELPVHRRPMR